VSELKSLALNVELIGVKGKVHALDESEEGKLFAEAMVDNKYLTENNQNSKQGQDNQNPAN